MISKDELNLLFSLNVVRVCSARWVLFLLFFAAAFVGQTIGWLVVRPAKKRSVHTLQKTVRNQVIQIVSFSQMISRIIHTPLHFYQNLLLHEFPLRLS